MDHDIERGEQHIGRIVRPRHQRRQTAALDFVIRVPLRVAPRYASARHDATRKLTRPRMLRRESERLVKDELQCAAIDSILIQCDGGQESRRLPRFGGLLERVGQLDQRGLAPGAAEE